MCTAQALVNSSMPDLLALRAVQVIPALLGQLGPQDPPEQQVRLETQVPQGQPEIPEPLEHQVQQVRLEKQEQLEHRVQQVRLEIPATLD
jgi:hypothetical protein